MGITVGGPCRRASTLAIPGPPCHSGGVRGPHTRVSIGARIRTRHFFADRNRCIHSPASVEAHVAAAFATPRAAQPRGPPRATDAERTRHAKASRVHHHRAAGGRLDHRAAHRHSPALASATSRDQRARSPSHRPTSGTSLQRTRPTRTDVELSGYFTLVEEQDGDETFGTSIRTTQVTNWNRSRPASIRRWRSAAAPGQGGSRLLRTSTSGASSMTHAGNRPRLLHAKNRYLGSARPCQWLRLEGHSERGCCLMTLYGMRGLP